VNREPQEGKGFSGQSRLTSHGSRGAAAALALALPFVGAHAFTVEHSATRYADRQYQCELTLMLAAPIERVEAVLRDYESYPTLDARILDARVVERPRDNVALIATTVRACFGPFCRNVKRLERVEEAPNALDAITDSARSDVKFGETRTRLEATSTGGTRVTYTTRITPGFWIPPLVGRRWMLNTLEQTTREVFRNVEKRAMEAPPHSF
jgi:Polyketide cyclase / dehydrase and lipid transport